jgi:alpha-glucosidase
MKTWKTMLALVMLVLAVAGEATAGEGAANRLSFDSGGAKIEVRFFERGAGAVTITAAGLESDLPTYMIAPEALAPAGVTLDPAAGRAFSDGLEVRYSADPLALSFYDRSGKLLLRLENIAWEPDGSYRLTFRKEPGDLYYGLGEMFAGRSYTYGAMPALGDLFLPKLRLNQDGGKLEVYDAHRPPSELVMPFILNPRGYGLLIEDPVRASIDFTAPDRFTYAAQGGPLRLHVIAGPSLYEIIAAYAKLTGRTPLPPRWVTGYMQSRYGYKEEAEFRSLMTNFRSRQIPCDVLIFDLDWYSTGTGCDTMTMGNLDWARERFPDPPGLMAELDRQGFHAINIVDPAVRQSSFNFAEVRDQKLVVTHEDGSLYYFKHWGCPGGLLLDYLNPAAQTWWGGKIKSIHDTGVDGWWTDKNEPEDELPDMFYGGQPAIKGHNLEAVLQHKAMADMYARELPDERLFIMSRAGFVGDWRYGVGIWSGDINSSWGHLARQVPVGLSAGLSGYGLWNSDVGGFHGTPSPELYIRWMQFGAFCPVFRAHGNHSIREPWAFGQTAEKILREVINLRYRLAPYHYNLLRELSESGKPPMRAMFLEFPEQPEANGVEDQYMYGPWLLVAPVTKNQARSRSVWLPAGQWTDFWTEEVHAGPGRVQMDAPLDHIPLLVREGAVLPMTELRQSIGTAPLTRLILHVYPGPARSSSALYDDDGKTNQYRDGGFTVTPIEVIAGAGLTIKIGPRQGRFTGMSENVSCQLVIHRAEKPAQVRLNGAIVPELPAGAGDSGAGFTFDAAKKLLTVNAGPLPDAGLTIATGK